MVELRDDEIELTLPTEGDVPAITSACQDPDNARYTTLPYPYTSDDAEDFVAEMVPQTWEHEAGAIWAIRCGGALAGVIGLHPRQRGVSEIGYWMVPDFRGQGLLSRAVGLAVNEGFGAGIQRIDWKAVVGNLGVVEAGLAARFSDRGGLALLYARQLAPVGAAA